MARRGRKPKRRLSFSLSGSTLRSIFALLLMIVSIVSLLAIFADATNSGGKAASSLKESLVQSMGIFAVFIPIALFYLGLLILLPKRNKVINLRIFFGLIMLFIGVAGVAGEAAGAVGVAGQNFLAGFVSNPGAIFLYFLLIILAILLITNTGFEAVFKRIGAFFGFVSKGVIPKNDKNDETDSKDEVKLLQPTEETPAEDPDFTDAEFETAENDNDYEMVVSGSDHEQTEFEIISPPSSPVLSENGNGKNGLESGYSEGVAFATDAEKEKLEAQSGAFLNQAGAESSAQNQNKLPFSNKVWEYPSLDLLSSEPNRKANAGNTSERSRIIEETLRAFGVKATMADINIGPAVTQYAVSPSLGTKTSKIQNLGTDFALRLKSPSGSVRIEAPIPGTNLIGIEVPNFSPSSVSLKSVMQSEPMKRAKSKLTIPLGHDVSGKSIIQDITRWPHALVAGATGSGKSVMLNAIITAILFRCSPQECRLIMIDPKMVELTQYNGIPHLLTPVVTDIEQKAVSAFAWAVNEMERRYKLFSSVGVRNIDTYNELSGFQAEPYIIIIVDELADMMMVAASEVEKYIIRLAQKSRATGIHLILATQRPSVNILTGTIKANIPTRIAFKVTSQVDSRVIIDQVGAETLIGRGDMLYVPPEDSKPRRVQGVYVSDKEIKSLVDYLKSTGLEPEYKEEILEIKVASNKLEGSVEGVDDKMVEALEIIMETGKASASYLQRRLGIGYTRAARIIDDLEAVGVIGAAQGSKPRDVMIASVDEALIRLKGQHDAEKD